jgi:Ca2+-binding RTX toxin-like protein
MVSAEANGAFTTPFNDENQLLSNSIWGNGGLGIDLGNDGVTTNTPGTHTSGPNLLQNSPVLTSATAVAGGNMTVSGYLDSTPNMTFTIQLYANASSGHGQGQDYLGQTQVTTDSTGQATFSFTYKPQPGVPFLSATATDANGNTSEFSVVNGAGATIVGNTLYLVGGSTTNDQVNIQPIGSSTTGSTGIQVNGRLGGSNLSVPYTQGFAAIYIIGFAGNESFQAANSLTIPLLIIAGNGNDNIQVGAGNNTISLGNGNDNIQAQNGNNTILVGNGNDNVQLGSGCNTVIAGNGNDTIQVGNGNNIVVAGNGRDQIQAGSGDNLIVGGGGTDTIQAGNGSNILIDGSVGGADLAILDQVLSEWMQDGSADTDTIRSQLAGIVTYNTNKANTLQAGSGLDWFWYADGQDHTNRKATDLLN